VHAEIDGASPTTQRSTGAVVARRLLIVALVVWGLHGLGHPGTFTLLDGVDLAVHETGHLVFGPFGEFIGVAGGTLFQLLIPAAFAISFWRRGDQHAACVALWWVAQSCGNVATYVADARAQELPLVGGGEHDWAYLLGETGLLSRDLQIAHDIRVFAVLLMIAAGIWGFLRAADQAADAT
jgi:hypothetical protein